MVVIWLDEGQWGPPPRLEQTGAEEARAGCINEQAVLKGTGSCNADEWSLQSRDERREQKGKRGEGEKSTVKWAQREQRWKKSLICTSDLSKLIYHVSSVIALHVSSPPSLSLPPADPNLLVFPEILPCFPWTKYVHHLHCICMFSNPKFEVSCHVYLVCLVTHHFMDSSNNISESFPSFERLLGLCVESWCILLSISPDWAAGALKVRRRRKHQEIYAHKKHELTGGPLTPL